MESVGARLCQICKNCFENRQFLVCNVCNKIYHLDCANVSTQRYYLMEPEKKQAWKCSACINKTREALTTGNLIANSTPDSCHQNVTQRKAYRANIHTQNSFDALATDEEIDHSTSIYSSPNLLNRSCPEYKTDVYGKLEQMQKIVKNLKEKLESAEQEIENLLSENFTLKGKITSYENKVSQLKNICRATPKKISSVNRKSLNRTRLDFTQCEGTTKKRNQMEGSTNVNLSTSKDNHSNQESDEPENHLLLSPFSITKQTGPYKAKPLVNISKPKICTIYGTNTYKQTTTANQHLNGITNTCHYVMPGGRVENLLECIEKKVHDFTHEDFCIIFFGDADFEYTENYHKKINLIKQKLQGLKHTNVILCLPTFKCHSRTNLFNRRVETFNRLLFLDNVKYEYAFILDSNKNLEYSHRMFTKQKGFLRRCGFRIILEDVKELMVYINTCYNESLSSQEDCSEEAKYFFRA